MITYPHLTQMKFEPLGDLTLMILEPWPEGYRKARSVKWEHLYRANKMKGLGTRKLLTLSLHQIYLGLESNGKEFMEQRGKREARKRVTLKSLENY